MKTQYPLPCLRHRRRLLFRDRRASQGRREVAGSSLPFRGGDHPIGLRHSDMEASEEEAGLATIERILRGRAIFVHQHRECVECLASGSESTQIKGFGVGSRVRDED